MSEVCTETELCEYGADGEALGNAERHVHYTEDKVPPDETAGGESCGVS